MDNSVYLKETKMLDFSAGNIQRLIDERAWKTLSEIDRTKAIYNFVKDEILFGYNVDDGIKASRVLKDGYGQCNTKGTLLMALFRACGIPCRVHGFMIDKILQKGAMSGFVYKSAPKEIFHSFVEAYVCGQWFELEGFILDNAYLAALRKLFQPEKDGSFIGYGVAIGDFLRPPVDFDCCNTYIQKDGIVRDFGVYDSPDLLLREHGQTLSPIKKCAYRLIGRRLMNKNVKRIRKCAMRKNNVNI